MSRRSLHATEKAVAQRAEGTGPAGRRSFFRGPARCRLLLLAALLAACQPAQTDRRRQIVVAGEPVAAADPQPAASAAGTPAARTCPATAPVLCGAGCCPAGSSCGDGGGADCVADVQAATCPAVTCRDVPDCSAGCSAIDSSAQGNHLTLSPPASYSEGRFDAGVAPGGGGCWNDLRAPTRGFPAAGAAVTIEAWLRPDSGTGSGSQTILAYGDREFAFRSVPCASGWCLALTWLGCTGTAGAIAIGGWQFVAAVWDPEAAPGERVRLYAGAERADSCPSGGPPDTPSLSTAVFGNCLSGALDEVRVLDYAASAGQIAQDAGGPLQAVPGTVGLWHFDEGAAVRCCAEGFSCGAGGGCENSRSACAGAYPVDAGGLCCPAGKILDAATGACVDPPAGEAVCPADHPVSCGDGTCCPEAFTCLAGGCVLEPAGPGSFTLCDPGSVPVYPASGVACCPVAWGGTPTIDDFGVCRPANPSCRFGEPRCPPGYSCDENSQCWAWSSAAHPCPAPQQACGNACCPAGATCGGPDGDGCCPAGTPACGDGCCDPIWCAAGACSAPAVPALCAGGTIRCGGLCCAASSSCTAGPSCGRTDGVAYDCVEGTLCGAVCCPDGTWCLSPGHCAAPPAVAGCEPGSVDCGAGTCCPAGFVCAGGLCQATSVPSSGPQGPLCPDGLYCQEGDLCAGDGCCPADHPLACGGRCCLADAPCSDGACRCPGLRIACGDFCCGAGALCQAGRCLPACPPELPRPCGDRCCGAGVKVVDGQPECPPDHPVVCGDYCCLPGASCTMGHCACPPGRPACVAGDEDLCCLADEQCLEGDCRKVSGPGCPGGWMGSGATCAPLGDGGSCQCRFLDSTSVCITRQEFEAATGLALPAACNPEGSGGCVDTGTGTLVHPCCPGLVCTVGAACGQNPRLEGGTCQRR